MPRHTPAQAKNAIRRALRAVVDPELGRQHTDELWTYFDSKCAYCGANLDRGRRQGQLDHLVPTTLGGTNHFSNRVLSCGPCNGDEKRERDWSEFLAEKVMDPGLLAERQARIERWRSAVAPSYDDSDSELLEQETARVLRAFDAAVTALRRPRT